KSIELKPLTKKVYITALLKFFYKLSRAIIVEKYVLYLPQKMGEIQIGKVENRWKINRKVSPNERQWQLRNYIATEGDYFRWQWYKFKRSYQTNSTYYRTVKFLYSSLYTFMPYEGDPDLGQAGLLSYILECYSDPNKPKYDVLNQQGHS